MLFRSAGDLKISFRLQGSSVSGSLSAPRLLILVRLLTFFHRHPCLAETLPHRLPSIAEREGGTDTVLRLFLGVLSTLTSSQCLPRQIFSSRFSFYTVCNGRLWTQRTRPPWTTCRSSFRDPRHLSRRHPLSYRLETCAFPSPCNTGSHVRVCQVRSSLPSSRRAALIPRSFTGFSAQESFSPQASVRNFRPTAWEEAHGAPTVHLLEPAADEIGPSNTLSAGGCIPDSWAGYPYAVRFPSTSAPPLADFY